MKTPNIRMLMGNHEQMMIYALDKKRMDNLYRRLHWYDNGGEHVHAEFRRLPEDEQKKIFKFIFDLPLQEQIKIGEQNFVLVHAGLNVSRVSKKSSISTANVLPLQTRSDMTWIRSTFIKNKALPKSITVFGHTPVRRIEKHISGKVWRDRRYNDKIGIDGGCIFGGSLLALRLDDMAEFAIMKI